MENQAFFAGAVVGAVVGGVSAYLLLTRQGTRLSTGLSTGGEGGGGDRPLREDDVEYKMVLCVRNDLKMGKGKIGAQCSHAAVGLYGELLEDGEQRLVERWEEDGCAKVALKVDTEEELLELEATATAHGIPSFMVTDAGRTQIAPNTRTVLALGPAAVDELDAVTGHLKLM